MTTLETNTITARDRGDEAWATRLIRLATAAVLGPVLALLAAALLMPASAAAESQTFFNTTPIKFQSLSNTKPDLYPSSIAVSGMEGPITDVDVNINAWDAGDMGGWALLLISPSGENELLYRFGCYDRRATNLFVTFDQEAQQGIPGSGDCEEAAGSYAPSDNRGTSTPDPFEDVISQNPSRNLTNFDNENANGTWRLYSYRWNGGGALTTDEIGAGWSLEIETGGFDLDLPAGGGTFGPASPYPATRTVSGVPGLITDVNVSVSGVFHTNPDDIDMVLEGPGGQRVMLMSDACGGYDVNAYGWTWDDEAPGAMPDEGTTNICGSPSYRPTNYGVENLPGPAPQSPYSSSLSAFDLTEAAGEWKLWVSDDLQGDEGFFTNRFTLGFSTRPRSPVNFDGPIAVSEGEPAELTVRRSGASAYAAATVDVGFAEPLVGADPSDYEPVNETLEFAPGQTEKTVEITAVDDSIPEGDETFRIRLGHPTGDASVDHGPSTIVTILANDGDQTAPDTKIKKAPKGKVASSKARVEFRSTEKGSTFECKLDRAPWEECGSPAKLRGLKPGGHRFSVRATDAAGNTDGSPAKAKWKVKKGR